MLRKWSHKDLASAIRDSKAWRAPRGVEKPDPARWPLEGCAFLRWGAQLLPRVSPAERGGLSRRLTSAGRWEAKQSPGRGTT